MRDAGAIIEEIVLICDAYENRERVPFTGTVQLFEDAVAHRVLAESLSPLVEEWNAAMREERESDLLAEKT